MLSGAFITGTDTGVGKTYFTALWTQSLRRAGVPALALKPVSSGDRSDAEMLRQASEESLTLEEINPIHFTAPLSPLAACRQSRKSFPHETLHRHLESLQPKYPGPFLVEGVGGWRVPFDDQYGVREWAVGLKLPVVVVARAGLGTLNHVLLTVDSILQTRLPILGIVLNLYDSKNDEATQTNPGLLPKLTGLPVFLLPNGAQPPLEIPSWLNLSS